MQGRPGVGASVREHIHAVIDLAFLFFHGNVELVFPKNKSGVAIIDPAYFLNIPRESLDVAFLSNIGSR